MARMLDSRLRGNDGVMCENDGVMCENDGVMCENDVDRGRMTVMCGDDNNERGRR